MGKHLRIKHSDDESDGKQPGCAWGLVHVLDYHHWQSNVRKMIHYRRYEGPTHDGCDWSPISNSDAYEAEKLLGEEHNSHLSNKRSGATKKRSLRARIKALIVEEVTKENKNTREKGGVSFKPKLQRTYSIHHLESVDEICTDWKHPIIFLPKDAENSSQSFDTTQTKADVQSHKEHESKENPDVFEIFKVDKELLLQRLQDSDESIASFSRSAFGLNTMPKFSKSRSFPVAELAHTRKLKPITLESKQKEVWLFPRENKFHTVNKLLSKSQPSEGFEEVSNREAKNEMDRIGEKFRESGIRKHTHRRSSSLNESLDKYARLFEASSGKDSKLNSSRSLKLTNEHGHAPLYFSRIHSLSYADSYFANLNLEALVDNPSGNVSVVAAKHSSLDVQSSEEENASVNAEMQIEEDYEGLRLHTRDGDSEMVDGLKEEAEKLTKSDSLRERDTNCSDTAQKKLHDQSFVLDEHHAIEPQISKGLDHGSGVHELSSSIATNDLEANELLSNDEISDNNVDGDENAKKKSEMDYVRHLLKQSGIAVDASEITWHSSNQLFSPQLFEEVEACWPHEQFELTECPDFYGCWHHQMLFDSVNEVLLEVYDMSLPYYPKALSSSCHVRPFPIGNHIIDEVCTSIGALVETKPEEKQSLDCIVARDLARDHSWMNLQLESEFIGLDIEDMIFNELLQEVIFS